MLQSLNGWELDKLISLRYRFKCFCILFIGFFDSFVYHSISSDYVHTMPAHFENGENVTVAKFELVFTQYRNNLKTVQNFTVNNSLQDFDAKEIYLRPKN